MLRSAQLQMEEVIYRLNHQYHDAHKMVKGTFLKAKTTLETSGEDAKTTLEMSGEDAKTTLETSGEDAKLHSKRVEKMRKLHSKRVEKS